MAVQIYIHTAKHTRKKIKTQLMILVMNRQSGVETPYMVEYVMIHLTPATLPPL